MILNIKDRFVIKIPDGLKHSHPVWFHCASVGEFNTARILIKRLKEKGYRIVVTYFSPRAKTFMETKVKSQVDWVSVLPIDMPFVIEKFNRSLNPKALIVVEREFWPFLLSRTKAPKILINTYAKGSFMEKLLIKKFDLIIARSDRDREILLREGANRVKVCGNLKFVFEGDEGENSDTLKGKIFVAGSTHEGEEEIILNLYTKLKGIHDDLKLIIAPRHISRSEELYKHILSRGFKVSLRTEETPDWDILILNTLGELTRFYKIASISFVGGTFVPVGGHNIAEPCRYDVPVIYGPFIDKVKDMASVLEELNIGFRVNSEEEALKVCLDVLGGKVKVRKGMLADLSKNIERCYMESLDEFLS